MHDRVPLRTERTKGTEHFWGEAFRNRGKGQKGQKGQNPLENNGANIYTPVTKLTEMTKPMGITNLIPGTKRTE